MSSSSSTLPPLPIFRILVTGTDRPRLLVFGGEKVPTQPVKFAAEESPWKESAEYVDDWLYPDDTLATVKLKAARALNIPLDEVFLYGRKSLLLRGSHVFATLIERQPTSFLMVSTLTRFLMNIVDDTLRAQLLAALPSTRTITLEQTLELPWPTKAVAVDVLLGAHSNPEVDLVCNPLHPDAAISSAEVTASLRRWLTGTNNQVLLASGELWHHTLVVALAEDVLRGQDADTQTLLLQRYFPFLHHQQVVSLEQLEVIRPDLIERRTQQEAELASTLAVVNLLYRVSTTPKPMLPIARQGIRQAEVTLHPQFNTTLPLDTIFKQLHTSSKRPLVRYHPSATQENLYRLYTAGQHTADGRSIPWLDKSTLYRVSKKPALRGKRGDTTLLFSLTVGERQEVTVECHTSGDLTCQVLFDVPQSEESVTSLLQQVFNHLLADMCAVLLLPESNVVKFGKLTDDAVQVHSLTWELVLQSAGDLDPTAFRPCANVVVLPQAKRADDEASSMWSGRYKRVGHYSQANAQEQFIMERVGKATRDEIVQGLRDSFANIRSTEEAVRVYRSVLADLELVETAPGQVQVQSNPGFQCRLQRVGNQGLRWTVEGITDAGYLDTVPRLSQALLRMWLSRTSGKWVGTEVSSQVRSLCTGTRETEVEDEEETRGADDVDVRKLQPAQQMLMTEAESAKLASLLFDEESVENMTEPAEDDDGNGDGENKKGKDGKEEEEEDDEEFFSKGFGGSGSLRPVGKIRFGGAAKKEPEEDEPEEANGSSSSEEELSDVEEKEVQEEGKGEAQVEGLKLTKPYYFQRRMEEYDPVLISKQSAKGQSNTYSRSCSSNLRKQPVVLTDAELQSIEQQHPGFLRKEDVLRYGSSTDKVHNYICPRFWCLKYNMPIDPRDLHPDPATGELVHVPTKPGQPSCGRVLPANATAAEDPYYIYEFHDEGKRYPGLMRPTLPHPKQPGLCYPCCFTKHSGNSAPRREINDSCMASAGLASTAPAVVSTTEAPETAKEIDYIKGPEKVPLDPLRWGQLQPALQVLLQDLHVACTTTRLSRTKGECLLRHGVQLSRNQSFVACLADALFFATETKIPGLAEMRDRLAAALTLDQFVTLQNGNLITDFFDPNAPAPDVTPYRQTNVVRQARKQSVPQQTYVDRVIVAFERYQTFLRDEASDLTPFYLWDLVCQPNAALFPDGVNLLILDIPADDITTNVKLACPSNAYAASVYDATRPSLLLVKQDDFYEPVYLFRQQQEGRKDIHVRKTFLEKDPQLPPSVKALLQHMVKPLLQGACRPQAPMRVPQVFEAKPALTLYELLDELQQLGYRTHTALMNFHGKVIGVLCSKHRTRGFVPCYPTALVTAFPDVLFLDDARTDALWLSFPATVKFLATLYQRSGRRIPCKPRFAVLEDGLAVGVLTVTDQFVATNPPINPQDVPTKYRLPVLPVSDSFLDHHTKLADTVIETSQETDQARVQYVRALAIETKLFEVFRNTVRVLLGRAEHAAARQFLQAPPSNLIYPVQLERAVHHLAQVCESEVLFTGTPDLYDDDAVLQQQGLCDATNVGAPLCSGPAGQLVVPKNNLLTGKPNKRVYLTRLADELLRYSRVGPQFFQPQRVLQLTHVSYNLGADEMLLMQSQLVPAYLETLQPHRQAMAAANGAPLLNSYDEVEPRWQPPALADDTTGNGSSDSLLGTMSESSVDGGSHTHTESDTDTDACKKTAHRILDRSPFWKKGTNEFCGEVRYARSLTCTFQFALDLLRNAGKQGVTTVSQLKQELFQAYAPLLTRFQHKIVAIWREEGKREIADRVHRDHLSVQDAVFLDTYFLSPLDVWVLAQTFQLPLVFLSETVLGFADLRNRASVAYRGSEKMVFVLVSPQQHESVPSFGWVVQWPETWLKPEGREQAAYAQLKPHATADLDAWMEDDSLALDPATTFRLGGLASVERALAEARTVQQYLEAYQVTNARQTILLDADDASEEEEAVDDDDEEPEEEEEEEKELQTKETPEETEKPEEMKLHPQPVPIRRILLDDDEEEEQEE